MAINRPDDSASDEENAKVEELNSPEENPAESPAEDPVTNHEDQE
jgi:hypothetical protein